MKVIKLVSQNSIEESILQQAQRKLELDHNLSGTGDLEKKIETGVLDELRQKLFGSGKPSKKS